MREEPGHACPLPDVLYAVVALLPLDLVVVDGGLHADQGPVGEGVALAGGDGVGPDVLGGREGVLTTEVGFAFFLF